MSIKEEPRRTLFVKHLEIPYVIHRLLQIPTRYINRSPKEMIEGRISAEKPRQISALVNLVGGLCGDWFFDAPKCRNRSTSSMVGVADWRGVVVNVYCY